MNIVKWYKNRSFQFKLVIGYLVLALIPMLCVTWYSYGKTRNVLLTEAYQSAEQEAERIEKNFGSIIFFVGLTLPRYRFSKPSASLDMNLR